jgi:nucleoside-triphosphatase
MKKRLLLLTGSPGVGKTTVLLRVVEALKARGFSLGGMVSQEVRGCGGRVGFEILNLETGERGWLAHINHSGGPRVGRYGVNLEDLEGIGVKAVVDAVEMLDVVVVDEVGPMELFSEEFRKAVKRAVESGKLVVGVVHWKAKDRLIDEIKTRPEAELYVVTLENRDNLAEDVIKRAAEYLKTVEREQQR